MMKWGIASAESSRDTSVGIESRTSDALKKPRGPLDQVTCPDLTGRELPEQPFTAADGEEAV